VSVVSTAKIERLGYAVARCQATRRQNDVSLPPKQLPWIRPARKRASILEGLGLKLETYGDGNKSTRMQAVGRDGDGDMHVGLPEGRAKGARVKGGLVIALVSHLLWVSTPILSSCLTPCPFFL